jgi:serine/threonine-protein kinase HipA
VSAKAVARVDVYKHHTRAGELSRTPHGALFTYDPAYAQQHAGDAQRGVAFGLPVRAEPYEVIGTNLHPFFAGLLPEGLRLKALVRALKTSEDDLFSLLVASGADTIGDVSVAAHGELPKEQAPVTDTIALSDISFRELFEQTLRFDESAAELSIAGVQPKVSAAMISFPVRAKDRRHAYILKLAPAEFPKLVENEAFFMAMAKSVGLPVAATRVVHDKTGEPALLVERFDRLAQKGKPDLRLHQEDACQLLDRYPADKYRLTLADVASALEVCSAPLAERLKLLRMQAFSYLIANGDMHAKNVSVHVVSSRVELTPCYDLLSTLPYGDRSLALSLDGRDDRLKRSHFCAFGERIGIRRAAVEQLLDTIAKRAAPWLPRVPEIGLDDKRGAHLARVMAERLAELT